MKKISLFLLVTAFAFIATKSVWARPLITTTFYLWYTTPHNAFLNSPDDWVYDPPFLDRSNDSSYMKRNLEDLTAVGFDGTFLVTYSPNSTTFKDVASHQYVQLALNAVNQYNLPMKFGAFVDWPNHKMTDDQLFEWDYTHDIKPFFNLIPRSRWLTHNGLPVESGGRPVIMVWTTTGSRNYFIRLKQQFIADFGVDPFLLVESNLWVPVGGDAAFDWNAPTKGLQVVAMRSYPVVSLGVGNNEQFIRPWRCNGSNPQDPVVNYHTRAFGGDPAGFIINEMNGIPNEVEIDNKGNTSEINMLFFQDSNEHNEGTIFLRAVNFPDADNPVINYCAPNYRLGDSLESVRNAYNVADNHHYVPQDFYMRAIRNTLNTKYGLPCPVQNPPMNVTLTCNGTTGVLSWTPPGGLIYDFILRINKNGQRYIYQPEGGTSVTTNSYSFPTNIGNTYNGWMQTRNICDTWSSAVVIPNCNGLDIDKNGKVDAADLSIEILDFGKIGNNVTDFDNNKVVNVMDAAILINKIKP